MQATRATPAPVTTETASPRRHSHRALIVAGVTAVAALGGVVGVHAVSTRDAGPARPPLVANVRAGTVPLMPGRQPAEDARPLPAPTPAPAVPAVPAATADAAAFSGPGGD